MGVITELPRVRRHIAWQKLARIESRPS